MGLDEIHDQPADGPDARPTSTGTESANRVADVLMAFARSDRPLGVTQLAREVDLSKAVVHRILQSLASRSLVQAVRGTSTYALGPAAIGLGTKAWGQLDVRRLAAPVLQRCATRPARRPRCRSWWGTAGSTSTSSRARRR